MRVIFAVLRLGNRRFRGGRGNLIRRVVMILIMRQPVTYIDSGRCDAYRQRNEGTKQRRARKSHHAINIAAATGCPPSRRRDFFGPPAN